MMYNDTAEYEKILTLYRGGEALLRTFGSPGKENSNCILLKGLITDFAWEIHGTVFFSPGTRITSSDSSLFDPRRDQ